MKDYRNTFEVSTRALELVSSDIRSHGDYATAAAIECIVATSARLLLKERLDGGEKGTGVGNLSDRLKALPTIQYPSGVVALGPNCEKEPRAVRLLLKSL